MLAARPRLRAAQRLRGAADGGAGGDGVRDARRALARAAICPRSTSAPGSSSRAAPRTRPRPAALCRPRPARAARARAAAFARVPPRGGHAADDRVSLSGLLQEADRVVERRVETGVHEPPSSQSPIGPSRPPGGRRLRPAVVLRVSTRVSALPAKARRRCGTATSRLIAQLIQECCEVTGDRRAAVGPQSPCSRPAAFSEQPLDRGGDPFDVVVANTTGVLPEVAQQRVQGVASTSTSARIGLPSASNS